MTNCEEKSDKKLFIFTENRSKLTLENRDRVESIKIHVDGCRVNDENIRCDYLHLAKGIEMFIELKGQDVKHAMKQIVRTMELLSVNIQTQKKINYIICTKSPLAGPEIQIFKLEFKRKYNAKLIIQSGQFKDSY